jgi:hypothetical protein
MFCKVLHYFLSDVHDVVMYSGAECYCDVTLSIYPHRAG